MDKIQLTVLGLSASPASNNAYALILKESDGNRRLPIIIGAFEAQAIALEMEGVMPPRPMTHDLMKKLIDSLGTNLDEVFINDLRDGTFYAKLIFGSAGLEIDARPSDAIALAVRFNSDIFVKREILDETGLLPQNDESALGGDAGDEMNFISNPESGPKGTKTPISTVDRLNNQLDKAIREEDYERAAEIRDEIKRILEST